MSMCLGCPTYPRHSQNILVAQTLLSGMSLYCPGTQALPGPCVRDVPFVPIVLGHKHSQVLVSRMSPGQQALAGRCVRDVPFVPLVPDCPETTSTSRSLCPGCPFCPFSAETTSTSRSLCLGCPFCPFSPGLSWDNLVARHYLLSRSPGCTDTPGTSCTTAQVLNTYHCSRTRLKVGIFHRMICVDIEYDSY